MSQPEFALIPTLMFCDYFLTVAGAVLKERGYDQVFEDGSYELNPLWQVDIDRKRWFNLRHSLLTLSITILLFVIVESGRLSPEFTEGFFGCLCILFGIIVGRHLANVIVLWRVADRVGRSAAAEMGDQELSLWTSTSQILGIGVPLALMTIFSFSPFAVGAVVAVGLMFAIHLGWIYRSLSR